MEFYYWFCVYGCGHIGVFEFQPGFRPWISGVDWCGPCLGGRRSRKEDDTKA